MPPSKRKVSSPEQENSVIPSDDYGADGHTLNNRAPHLLQTRGVVVPGLRSEGGGCRECGGKQQFTE